MGRTVPTHASAPRSATQPGVRPRRRPAGASGRTSRPVRTATASLHGDVGATRRAAAAVVELPAAASVLEDHRPLPLEPVPVAPLQQRDQHRPQVGALLGQPVLAARRAVLVGPLHQDPLLDEALEPGLQHIAGHAEVTLQLLEAADPQEDVADDQERPTLAHHLECGRHRAVLVGVVTLQHRPSIPRFQCYALFYATLSVQLVA